MCSGASTEINSYDNLNMFSIFSIFICIISPCFWWDTRCEICWATNEHFMMMSCKVSKNPAGTENDPRYRSACPPWVTKHWGCCVFIADSAFATVISTTSHTYLQTGKSIWRRFHHVMLLMYCLSSLVSLVYCGTRDVVAFWLPLTWYLRINKPP